jgi:hypothetical protein
MRELRAAIAAGGLGDYTAAFNEQRGAGLRVADSHP